MTRFYLIDDDPSVINVLKIIIEDSQRGKICGYASNGEDALEDLKHDQPDIVLVDLLMPVMDGISFVRQAKKIYPNVHFVMLSHVSSKDMIAEAYQCGVEFYIQKPINSVEVLNVIEKVSKLIHMNRAFEKMQSLLQIEIPLSNSGHLPSTNKGKLIKSADSNTTQSALNVILQKLGISGDPGSKDISQIVLYLCEIKEQATQPTIVELCTLFSDSPKSMEQRIRRAVTAGMVNLAHLGIEDYTNDVFTEYAGTLYKFEQVRCEMDFIREKTDKHGKVSLKNFLYSLSALSDIY